MPKEQLHGSISIIKQRLELAANMGKMRAIKHQMPLIPWSPSVTECASTQMPRDSWPSKPALLYWKRVGPHAKLHQMVRFNLQECMADLTISSPFHMHMKAPALKC